LRDVFHFSNIVPIVKLFVISIISDWKEYSHVRLRAFFINQSILKVLLNQEKHLKHLYSFLRWHHIEGKWTKSCKITFVFVVIDSLAKYIKLLFSMHFRLKRIFVGEAKSLFYQSIYLKGALKSREAPQTFFMLFRWHHIEEKWRPSCKIICVVCCSWLIHWQHKSNYFVCYAFQTEKNISKWSHKSFMN
jgi:hypothetical protein